MRFSSARIKINRTIYEMLPALGFLFTPLYGWSE